jgi:predicted nucleotidyltransferase
MISKIDKLFGSKTRVTLLSKLLMNPDRSFYMRELSKELNMPYSMLHREVKNLASLNIVNEDRRGKVTFLCVNKRLPYFTDIRQLIAKTAGLGDLVRKGLSGLKGIKYALVYGSMATLEDTESSDVDLLIIGNVGEEEALKAIAETEKEAGREINYLLWSDNEFMRRVRNKHHLLMDIAGKPLIMILGEEDEFRRIIEKKGHS